MLAKFAMTTAPVTLNTIGYQATTMHDFLRTLTDARVTLLVDVRRVASSRRPGFAKTSLTANLASVGIDYLHLRDLGTPKDGRIAARAGRVAEMHAIYERHLQEPAAQLALSEAVAVASERKAALLCYEARACVCHRRIVADLIHERTGVEVVDL